MTELGGKQSHRSFPLVWGTPAYGGDDSDDSYDSKDRYDNGDDNSDGDSTGRHGGRPLHIRQRRTARSRDQ